MTSWLLAATLHALPSAAGPLEVIPYQQATRPQLSEVDIQAMRAAGARMYGSIPSDLQADLRARTASAHDPAQARTTVQGAARAAMGTSAQAHAPVARATDVAQKLRTAQASATDPTAAMRIGHLLDHAEGLAKWTPPATGPATDPEQVKADLSRARQDLHLAQARLAALQAAFTPPLADAHLVEGAWLATLVAVAEVQTAQAEALLEAANAIPLPPVALPGDPSTKACPCDGAAAILDLYFGDARVKSLPDLVVYYKANEPLPAMCLVRGEGRNHGVLQGEKELYVLVFSEYRLADDPTEDDAVDLSVGLGGLRSSGSVGAIPSGLLTGVSVPDTVNGEVVAQLGSPTDVELHALHSPGSTVPLYYGHASFELKTGSLNRVRVSPTTSDLTSSYFTIANARGMPIGFSVGAGWAFGRNRMTFLVEEQEIDDAGSVVTEANVVAGPADEDDPDGRIIADDLAFYATVWLHPQRLARSWRRVGGITEVLYSTGVGLGIPITGSLLTDPAPAAYLGLRTPIFSLLDPNKPWSHWGLTFGGVVGPRFNDIAEKRQAVRDVGLDPDDFDDLDARLVWRRWVVGIDYQF